MKIENNISLCATDIRWLIERNAYSFLRSVENQFTQLQITYKAIIQEGFNGDLLLFLILQKLDESKRLEDVENQYLRENGFVETLQISQQSEFSALVNASAAWRKAENPGYALKLTENLDIEPIKPSRLKAALLTTRGGALRDINNNHDAEKCALEAIKHFPDKHDPYTLMGALCFDDFRYDEGSKWFEEAVKRGAKENDQETEIRRILRKKQNQDLVEYLLKKDTHRFAWVKDFSAKIINNQKRFDKFSA